MSLQMRISKLDSWKLNLLNLIRDHRAHCTGDCGASLIVLCEMAEAAGLTFTQEEHALFM